MGSAADWWGYTAAGGHGNTADGHGNAAGGGWNLGHDVEGYVVELGYAGRVPIIDAEEDLPEWLGYGEPRLIVHPVVCASREWGREIVSIRNSSYERCQRNGVLVGFRQSILGGRPARDLDGVGKR
jgi:hypothetical protein